MAPDPKVEEYLEALYQDQLKGITPEVRQAINRGEITEEQLARFYDGIAAQEASGREGWEADFAARYPQWSYLLDDPELKVIFKRAIDEGPWSSQELLAQISQTNWYRSRSADQRSWELLVATDPAEAERALERQTQAVRNMASSQGISLGAGIGRQLARESLKYGMTDSEIKAKLVTYIREGRVEASAGGFDGAAMQIRQMADAYMIRLSDKRVKNMAMRVFAGETSVDAIQQSFIEKSRQAYPWMIDQLNSGLTPKEFYAPLVGDVANLLEIAPDSINLMDPQWSPIVSISADGQTRAPTRTEVEQWARAKPEWLQTRNGAASSAQMGRDVLETMGAVAT